MEINKLNICDLNKIYDLNFHQFKDEAWSLQQIEASMKNNSINFYGIKQNDKLICYASILNTADDINLLQIATDESFKKIGLASSLMNYLINLDTQKSFSLEVKSKNIPAINLYKKYDLKVLNVRKKYYKDGDDALCMFLRNKF